MVILPLHMKRENDLYEKEERMIKAGASRKIINPDTSQFLFGYPHVKRYSTGVHDDLETACLYITDGTNELVIITNDLIFVSKQMTERVRTELNTKLGIPQEHILISATHTHSGPLTVNYASNTADPVVPLADTNYIAKVCERMIECALEAKEGAEKAEIGLVHADSTGIGTNRRDPSGPSDHDVPVLLVRSRESGRYIACMLVISMHPTVLHEDSTLISADFIGAARARLKEQYLTERCVVLTHNGPCGNQSPRHVVRENSFAEAKRLGDILADAVSEVLGTCSYSHDLTLYGKSLSISDVPRRTFSAIDESRKRLQEVNSLMARRKQEKAPAAELRTIECDIFGAEEMVTLSRMQESGELEQYYSSCLPVEIQRLSIGPWNFIGWSGEVFTDYARTVKQELENTFVISMANGEMQGYVTTEEAALEGGYEASNALFSHETGELLVNKSIELCQD